jgi:FAD/FMN-containing dehydrogenase/Fe-S oxidoreductase
MTRPLLHPHSELEAALRRALLGEVRFDAYTRHLYSTDASIYAIEPIGVVYPRNADDVVATVEIATQHDVPVLPRGAGTGLCGQTVGRAVVIDFSRFMHEIVALDAEAHTARVQPGVVQDDLNRAAARYGLFFAPDTSTSNRATLGGMVGNNSCGARSARYGMTIDHVESLEVVLSDGSRAHLAAVDSAQLTTRVRGDTLEAQLYRDISRLIAEQQEVIRDGFPPHWRRSGGYRLERMLPEAGPFDLSRLVIGSEGTLAIVVEATVRLVQSPLAVVGLAGHFDSVDAALAAVDDALEVDAAAIELVDKLILDLARRSPLHAHRAATLSGDPGALLWLEFYGDSRAEAKSQAERLEAKWRAHGHGYAIARADTSAELQRFRELRKAGLGLLSAAGEGQERSIAFVEDTAVDPRQLRAYTRRFAQILERHGLCAGFYGHASAGCLHIRPFMDLQRPADVARMRAVAEEVRDLVREFGGMNSSEHGDGLVRSEFNRQLFGDALYDVMCAVKRSFDPQGRLNPGKKVDAPAMSENLREPALPRPVQLPTHFAFAQGMHGHANRCARIGACRKSAESGGTMCPSYMATRDEQHSTRGRANALVKALSAANPREALGDERLHEILDLCLECKACKRECPLSIDMAALKAETLAQHYEQHGVPLRARAFGNIGALNRVGSALAPVSNWIAAFAPARAIMQSLIGLERRRPLPVFQRDTLSTWFAARRGNDAHARRPGPVRGPVVFLADCFTSYTEPWIGRAAIELLEAAGWEVKLAADVCCGRALISKGLLDLATLRHADLIRQLAPAAQRGIPIVGVEPSCVLTLKDELPALSPRDDGAAAIAQQTRLVDDLLVHALDDGTLEVGNTGSQRIVFHGHCHQKAAGATAGSISLLERIANGQLVTLDAGCCGMAGSFGFEREHYDLSMQIGGLRLFPAINAETPETRVAATGTSCRQQIAHGTGRQADHPVMLLRAALR